MRLGLSLATIGVAVSVTVVALASHYVLGLPWELAVLLGACLLADRRRGGVLGAARGAAAQRLVGALEAESGLNDAPTVVLVTLISTGAVADDGPLGHAGIIVFELVVGVAVGLAVGFGGAWVMRRAALPSSGLYPLAVLCLLSSPTARPRPCTPPGSRRCTSPRWCSATPSCRTARPPAPSPRASPGWPRSGCS